GQGPYTVWLYDSVAEARPLARFRGSRASLDLRLPRGLSGYRYLDVSREPPDGNPNHSGESVLRTPLGRLTRPG
ncbi:MAG: anti-sigma factor, partial [Actinomycetota bacterium]|nr:anti-sigma factor [Actinomycetota bacterium]